MQIHDIIPGLGMPTMVNYAPPQQAPGNPSASRRTSSITPTEMRAIATIGFTTYSTCVCYVINGAIWSRPCCMQLLNISHEYICMALVWLFVFACTVNMDGPDRCNKKKSNKKSENRIPSWDDEACFAWSGKNWEELAREAAYKERAQARGEGEMKKVKRKTKFRNMQKRVGDLYIAIRILTDIVEGLKEVVDRQEERVEEIQMKRMEMEKTALYNESTLKKEEDEGEDGMESSMYKHRCSYWCRQICCLHKERKVPALGESDDEHHSGDDLEHEEYEIVTAEDCAS